MDLQLIRDEKTDVSTIGKLSVNGEYFSETLEDAVRCEKIMHKTAIPAGKYEVVINFSNRFQKQLPLLLNVPNFEGVRIHPGNTSDDTSGCILVGKTRGKNFIGQSKVTFDKLMTKLRTVSKTEKIFITIV